MYNFIIHPKFKVDVTHQDINMFIDEVRIDFARSTIINPNNKLPLSPKNNLGRPKKEKLKNINKKIGIIKIIKKN